MKDDSIEFFAGEINSCWAGGGLQTLISFTMKSDLHSSRTKLQAWPMNIGDNDFKLF